MAKRITQVMVEKAELTLLDGEDLSAFVQSLKEPCLKHLTEKGLFNGETDMAFPAQVFADKIMVDVMKGVRGPSDSEGPDECTYEVKFSRDASGAYTFVGEPTEVERKMVYAPVQKSEVMKSLWHGVI